MRKELGTPGAAIGMAALVLLFGGLVLAIYPGWGVIGKWLDRADAPAWVQAVGSILAILVAVGIAMWQRHSDRAESDSIRKARADVVAYGVLEMMPPLIAFLRMVTKNLGSSSAVAQLKSNAAADTLRSLVIPTENQLLVLAEAAPEAATYLAWGCTTKIQLSTLLDTVKGELAAGHAVTAEKVFVATSVATQSAIAFRDAAKLLCFYLDVPNDRFDKKILREDEFDRTQFPPFKAGKKK
ncbi:hypothetical protein [Variovorax arabinosiphilus]|uniref:hypothetical protein n=1 Tax=Variovorax arabinosiphilus TaxID=3053498 RepID=UPI002576100A|nr:MULTISPECIES: hypothetical protein [unclassified Variovorax]MDM0118430.1 hypothetical protein [Variovorax sp. J2L1-78]MDM0128855.1 hypothetical protein [Variovorax sp. J2L1-63]MDM0233359.1 hypothetical protein [Variovorax sp. J2R1-6]